MNLQDIIKLQLVSQLGAAAAGHPGATAAAAGHHPHSLLAMLHQFLFMLLVSVIDDLGKAIPKLCEDIKSFFVQHASRKVRDTARGALHTKPQDLKDASILLSTRHPTNSLVMARTFVNPADGGGGGLGSGSSGAARASLEESDGMVDALLAHISKLDNVPLLKLIDRGQIMVAYKDKPIQIAKDVFVKIDAIGTAAAGGGGGGGAETVSSIRMTLLSNALSAAELAAYAKNVYAKHQEELKNSLGNNIYFFDHKSRDGNAAPPPLPPSTDPETLRAHKRMLLSTAPKHLSFTMTPFYSNKSFSNIFGSAVRTLEKRVRFFLDHRDWYDRKGVPYQLGLLLSGIPGAGKTSVIRAIANLTKRHIINVNFANITTATQLKHLFYSDKLAVYTDASLCNSQPYFIPIEQRLYVLEEIDAIGDIVKQRRPAEETAAAADAAAAAQLSPIHDELTLAEILTVLDGTMEVPGRIIVMTSNHPEVLDQALVRPGRIDVQVHFDKAAPALIAEMFEAYLEAPFPRRLLPALPDARLTPAEVGQVIFRNVDTPKEDQAAAVVRDLRAAAEAAEEAAAARQRARRGGWAAVDTAEPAASETPVQPGPEPVRVSAPAPAPAPESAPRLLPKSVEAVLQEAGTPPVVAPAKPAATTQPGRFFQDVPFFPYTKPASSAHYDAVSNGPMFNTQALLPPPRDLAAAAAAAAAAPPDGEIRAFYAGPDFCEVAAH
jgi:hypothetical protein